MYCLRMDACSGLRSATGDERTTFRFSSRRGPRVRSSSAKESHLRARWTSTAAGRTPGSRATQRVALLISSEGLGAVGGGVLLGAGSVEELDRVGDDLVLRSRPGLAGPFGV